MPTAVWPSHPPTMSGRRPYRVDGMAGSPGAARCGGDSSLLGCVDVEEKAVGILASTVIR
jgi:hypothetical protein